MYELMTSYFLGDPPPDPRFLASLGMLSSGQLHHFFIFGLSYSCLGWFPLGKKEGRLRRRPEWSESRREI
jgi:hypothetical protein